MKTKRSIRILLVMLLGGAVFAVFFAWQYQMPPKVIARVDGANISQYELSLRLRELLWREGKDWDHLNLEEQSSLRIDATNALVDEQLLQQWIGEHPAPIGMATTEYDFQQFLKQFESPNGWQEQAAMQGLNEPQLREMLARETTQRSVLEAWLYGEIRVSEEESQAWFADHQQELLIPECVRASHIFLSGHDKDKPDRAPEMSGIYQRLTRNEATFNELAAKLSEDGRSNKKGGDLGWFTRERVPKDFAEVAFSLSTKEMSKPFRTSLGWHIVWMQDHLAQRLPKFAEVQPEITAILESGKREALLNKLMQELRQKARIIRNEDIIRVTKPPSLQFSS